MQEGLYLQTVSVNLIEVLQKLMEIPELKDFRLVGGTALSLQLGHRISRDIDLFTDKSYGSVNFGKIDKVLRQKFSFVEPISSGLPGPGIMYFVGETAEAMIKLDLFYTDPFVLPVVETDGFRMAQILEVAAMKLEVISRSGRKKDFWDMAELLDHYTFTVLLDVFNKKYPYLDTNDLLKSLISFDDADDEANPLCLRGRYWELIKADIQELVNNYGD